MESEFPTGIPLGLKAACIRIYSNEPNVKVFWARRSVEYRQGGSDPLDYVAIFFNSGNLASDIAPHWHYIGFGLSDLYSDGRVNKVSENDMPSGYGFELTFRLKRESDEHLPPKWPPGVMQVLARHVFKSGKIFRVGHTSLLDCDSRMKHVLMFEDPQLGTVETQFGPVTFLQIIRLCPEEYQAALGGNGPGIIELMKSVKGAGGPWLITDMRRCKTVFELDSPVQDDEADGSQKTASCRLRKLPEPEKQMQVIDGQNQFQKGQHCDTLTQQSSFYNNFWNFFTNMFKEDE